MALSRRHLQLALGLLWLLDAGLQLQPFMFSAGFARDVVAPAGSGQPGWVSGPVSLSAQQIATHPAIANSAFALTQLALAVGFFWPRTVRLAVVASIVWALSVWWLGEGLGGLPGGHGTLITGAPGAAVLYAVLAIAAWSPHNAPAQPMLPTRLRHAWAAIWIGGATLQVVSWHHQPTELASQLRDGADGAPGWLSAADHAAARTLSAAGQPGLLVLTALMTLIGLGALATPALRTASISVGGVLTALFWLVGQNLGEIYTGQATDPNTGPLLLLLGLAVLATQRRGTRTHRQAQHPALIALRPTRMKTQRAGIPTTTH